MCSYTTLWFIVITIHISGYRHFLTLIVSQGSVATLVRCDRIFNANFIANFLTSQPVKELWKSAGKKGDVFWDTVHTVFRENFHVYHVRTNTNSDWTGTGTFGLHVLISIYSTYSNITAMSNTIVCRCFHVPKSITYRPRYCRRITALGVILGF